MKNNSSLDWPSFSISSSGHCTIKREEEEDDISNSWSSLFDLDCCHWHLFDCLFSLSFDIIEINDYYQSIYRVILFVSLLLHDLASLEQLIIFSLFFFFQIVVFIYPLISLQSRIECWLDVLSSPTDIPYVMKEIDVCVCVFDRNICTHISDNNTFLLMT